MILLKKALFLDFPAVLNSSPMWAVFPLNVSIASLWQEVFTLKALVASLQLVKPFVIKASSHFQLACRCNKKLHQMLCCSAANQTVDTNQLEMSVLCYVLIFQTFVLEYSN